jgi:hypothetical protein
MRNMLDVSVIILLVLFVLFSLGASAQTVINYEDGSTYTLADDQEIYISTPSSALFKRQLMKNKDTFFRVQSPWATRDYIPGPEDEYTVGSHEWCKAYIPWSEGLTFDMVSWQRYCDTNNDGVYSESDSGWEG